MLDPENLSALKVTELKAELKKRGLPVGGLKSILIERLQEGLLAEQQREQQEDEGEENEGDGEEQSEEERQPEESVHEENADSEVPDDGVDATAEPQGDVRDDEVVDSAEPAQDAQPDPLNEPSAEDSLVKASLDEDAPGEDAPDEDASDEVAPDEDAPDEDAPDEDAPAPATENEKTAQESDTMKVDAEATTPPSTDSAAQAETHVSEEPPQDSAPEEQEAQVVETEASLPTATSQEEAAPPQPVEELPEDNMEVAPGLPQEQQPTEDFPEDRMEVAPGLPPQTEQPLEDLPEDRMEVAPGLPPQEEEKPAEAAAPPVEPALAKAPEVQTETQELPPSEKPAQDALPDVAPPHVELQVAKSPAESKPVEEVEQPEQAPEAMDTTEDKTDIRKRKRRSITPPPSTSRAALDSAQESPLQDDDRLPIKKARYPSPVPEEEAPANPKQEPDLQPKSEPQEPDHQDHKHEENDDQTSPSKPPKTSPTRRLPDARFKGLFNHDSRPPRRPSPASSDDLPVPPSIHPATRTLYIRDLMRPLSEASLKAHLKALSSRPSSSSFSTEEQPEIEFFFLDNIKSHAFVTFSTLTAATRVRVGIHGRVWPNESTRKELWADFVPEERVEEWVGLESEGGRERWEVDYRGKGEDVEVELVRAGSGGIVPTGPRPRSGSEIAPTISQPIQQQQPQQSQQQQPTKVIKQLDELFRSTTAKPKLYWMPVSDDVARERLERARND
ncbi:hypothetical protein RUND412_002093 [Rhizina undulata]